MDLERMLDKCRKGQWRIDQLDWNVQPRELSRKDEIAIVQYFTDMAAIERLAGALFAVQRDIVEDEILKKIFATFVADEERHAQAAEKLANHYNVHNYKRYGESPELTRFRPHFLNAIRYVSPAVANMYITAGELMLDIALLRSLNDYVNDAMSNQVMDLINRDESRHIAMDHYMFEYYDSREYRQRARKVTKRKTARDRMQAAWAFGNMLFYARPFALAVFLRPMEILDPEGKRMREAVKRSQLLLQKSTQGKQTFEKFMLYLRKAYNTPVVGQAFGKAIARIAGAPPEYMVDVFTEEERKRAMQMTMEQMGEEALNAKFVN
jgi:hypothetical protein